MKTYSFAVLAAFISVCSVAEADQLRFAFTSGPTSAGSLSGGLVFAPSASYAMRLSEWFDLSATNRLLITGTFYHNIGVVDHSVFAIGITGRHGFASVGPSLDILDTILCGENRFCNRVAGTAPGAQFGGAIFSAGVANGRVGIGANAHMSWILPGPIYTGPLFTVDIGPVLRLGRY